MKRSRVLESRLEEWGREYGGGKYENVGEVTSWLGKLVKWGGRAPTGMGQVQLGTAADEVQEAIEALDRQPQGRIPACVIRCEYLTPGQPIELKMHRLHRVGIPMVRIRYAQHLRIARVHVAAWIHVPFEEIPGIEESAA